MAGGKGKYVAFALVAAALYALSTPFSKMLLEDVPSNMMAALLYLGAGMGMAAVGGVQAASGKGAQDRLTRADIPYVVGMVVLDIGAPLLLMAGLTQAPAENVALLNNFEIVATAAIASLVFKEPQGTRLRIGVIVITLACVLLTVEDVGALHFSGGSILVVGACVCWGLENNCTSKISDKDPVQIVVVKGFGSGMGALAIAFAFGDALPSPLLTVAALALGFVAYGLSIFFYVRAQRGLGAARTSAFYGIAPFVGVLLAWALFRQTPGPLFLVALVAMGWGTWLVTPRAGGSPSGEAQGDHPARPRTGRGGDISTAGLVGERRR